MTGTSDLLQIGNGSTAFIAPTTGFDASTDTIDVQHIGLAQSAIGNGSTISLY